ncbi:Hsp20/alpha crystallin family protein [Bradyrhizobium elkanii]|jgi:HSP20 family protein|uniref:Hsp20/alpha crystallin family protein n=2 Tax=Nitrobacteraceae TaxID=41294 RepID=UPI0006886A54|nr:Hsp20/alpha crystallin family protein [Bradyrhizobium elkanii]WLA96743.1 Hsp20/alpha crystallin family protein [Bradyrhizobium elkanii]WLC11587.1 Hsp20/alpha crystallin family protein [Bradyrhizobium elkanii USDA 94]
MMAPNSTAPVRSGNPIQRDIEAPFHSLHHEINRLFGEVFLHGHLHRQSHLSGDRQGPFMPSINVSETDGEMRISADLPGVRAEDIDVTLVDDILTIRAEKTLDRADDKESFHILERSHGTLLRTLRLPYSVDTDKMKADFDNGVLIVALPINRDKERARRIPVQVAAQGGAPTTPDRNKAGAAAPEEAYNANPKPKAS